MAWPRPGDQPSSEPMMVSLPMHICINQPQWVKRYRSYHIIPTFLTHIPHSMTFIAWLEHDFKHQKTSDHSTECHGMMIASRMSTLNHEVLLGGLFLCKLKDWLTLPSVGFIMLPHRADCNIPRNVVVSNYCEDIPQMGQCKHKVSEVAIEVMAKDSPSQVYNCIYKSGMGQFEKIPDHHRVPTRMRTFSTNSLRPRDL